MSERCDEFCFVTIFTSARLSFDLIMSSLVVNDLVRLSFVAAIGFSTPVNAVASYILWSSCLELRDDRFPFYS